MAKQIRIDEGRLGRIGAESVRRRAEKYAKEPGELSALLGKAQAKANDRQGPLSDVWEELMLLFRMLRAYARGSYRVVPWQSLLLVIGAVVYFVMPIELIPDAILGFGFLDDAAVIAWTVRSTRRDLEAFKEWERNGEPGAGRSREQPD